MMMTAAVFVHDVVVVVVTRGRGNVGGDYVLWESHNSNNTPPP